MFNDFLFLLFPEYCTVCGETLVNSEKHLCTSCLFHLPKTEENGLEKIFWGRVPIENTDAFLQFHQRGMAQQIIHQIKYQQKRKLGKYIGQLYGHHLRTKQEFETVDLILPVPLHPKKKRKRGYNQCDLLAAGLSESLQIEWNPKLLIRNTYQGSQTAKSRYERWENIRSSFQVKSPEEIEGKHILLVDDVITTGATLEACAQSILSVPGTKISIATLAYTAL